MIREESLTEWSIEPVRIVLVVGCQSTPTTGAEWPWICAIGCELPTWYIFRVSNRGSYLHDSFNLNSIELPHSHFVTIHLLILIKKLEIKIIKILYHRWLN